MQDMGPEEKRVLGARDAQRLPATKCVLASKLLAQSGSGDVVREARKDWIHRVCMLGRCLLQVLCFSQSSAEFEVTLSGEAFPLRLHAGGCCVFACDVLVSHPVSCTFELGQRLQVFTPWAFAGDWVWEPSVPARVPSAHLGALSLWGSSVVKGLALSRGSS